MTTVAMIGILYDRPPFSIRSIAIAALIILILSPESLLSASFQLSFAAVLALITVYNHFIQKITFKFATIKIICGLLLTTLVATIATTPYTIALFQRFTMQALLSNFLVIPLLSFYIMPLALLSVFSLLFGGWSWAFWWWEKGINLMVEIAFYVAGLPGAAITMATPHPLFIVCITIGFLWVCLWQKKQRWYGIFPISIGIGLLFWSWHPNVYIAGNGSLIAYRQSDTLHISNKKYGWFYKKMWLQELNLTNTKCWFQPYQQIGNLIIAGNYLPYKLLKKLPKDSTLTYITTQFPKKHLPLEPIINRNELKKFGSHALWVDENGAIKKIAISIYNRIWD